MAKDIEKDFIDNTKLVNVDIRDEIEKNFLEYAMSVIVSRALPDLKDGLKPVHRRIIFAMNDLRITAESQHKKSARIVGEVIGKYHPHGDSSVYEAMVRMAQDFSYRYPLVDGHGNFGSIDGDGAAAMRYTEARLSKISSMLLKDIDMNIVPFSDNYDATEKEPLFLPSYFLNLLANGATGIAVGMATSIPPHNIRELNNAIIAFIKNQEISIDELCKYIKAPDFPTGAMVTFGSRLESAYKTGRGSVTIKAKAHIEKISEDKERIVITEIPYQTNKAKILEKIVELYRSKTITGLTDIRDESNYKGIRIVLELAKFANSQIILTKLYKFTNLQTNLSINMLALKNGIPTVLNLKEIIKYYYKHQIEMLINKIKFEQAKISSRVHILKALIVAISNIDDVIDILKTSKTNEIASEKLNSKYNFDEKQTKAILDMKLQRIVGLERSKIENEISTINLRLEEIDKILHSKEKQDELIINQLEYISEKFGDERKTEIISEEQIEIEDEELIADTQMMITLSKNNYIRRLSLDEFRSQKRGGKGVIINTNADDYIVLSKIGRLKDEILFFTDKGRVYKIKAYNIPQFSRTSRGIPVINYLNIQKDEKVSTIVSIKTEKTKFKYLFFITKKGLSKRVATKEFTRVNNMGKIAITLDENDELAQVVPVTGNDRIIIGTKAGKILKINQQAFRAIGRKTRGVKAVKLSSNDDFVVGACSDYKNEFLLTISDRGIMKKTKISEYSEIGRNSKGSIGMKINDKTGLFSMMFPVRSTDELIMISSIGKIIKIGLDEINIQARNTVGVKGISLDKDEFLTCTTIVWNKQPTTGLKESLIEDTIIDDETEKVLTSKDPTIDIDDIKNIEDDDEI